MTRYPGSLHKSVLNDGSGEWWSCELPLYHSVTRQLLITPLGQLIILYQDTGCTHLQRLGSGSATGGNMMMTVISVLSRQGPRWHDDGAPKGGRIPTWILEGWGQDQGLSLGWKNRAHLGCFQWQRLLVWLAIRTARKGVAAFFILRERGK
jgi:hypothetical protein